MTIKIKKLKIKINQRRMFYSFGFLVLFVFGFYLFNLGSIISSVTKITKMQKDIASLDRKVGEMEAKLITKRNNINLNLAYSMGFEEAREIKFIPKKSVAVALKADSLQ